MLKLCVGFVLLIPVILSDKKQDDRFIFLQNDYMIKFERMELVRFNDHYMTLSMITSKYNRTCPVVNLSFSFKIDIGEDYQVIIQAYTFLSNEYRTFPLHFQVGFCEAVEKDMIGMSGFKKCGNFTGCPMKKGIVYRVCNWAPDPAKYPPNMPNGQYMLEFQGMLISSELYLVRLYMTISRPVKILS